MGYAVSRTRLMHWVIVILLATPLLFVGLGRALGLARPAVAPAVSSQARVAIVKADHAPSDAEIEAMVRQGLELALGEGGMGNIVAPGAKVVIKVNLGVGLEAHEITSWQVARAVALSCQEAGASRVLIAESPERGLDHYAQAGYTEHLSGVDYIDLGAASTSLAPVLVQDSLWPSGQEIVMPADYVNADVVISIPKMKTHSTAGVTISLKNAVGVPPVSAYRSSEDVTYRDRFHNEFGIHKTIVQINQARLPDLAVIDAILSGEGNGPWGASPVQTNMVLVSRDLVAADTVAATCMGFDPERVRHLVYAAHQGLGQTQWSNIEIVGTPLSSARTAFGAPSNVARLFRRTSVVGLPPTGQALDGDLAEWEGQADHWLRKRSEVQEGAGSWSGESDASLRAWVAYDGEALYLAARVFDSQLQTNQRSPGNLWNGDAVELYLSGAAQDAGGRDSAYQASDFRLGLGYGQNKLVDIGRGTVVSAASVATRPLSDGYAVEARVPWSALNNLQPSRNREIGFDLALDDADGAASRESFLVWSGTVDLPGDVREMGVLLMSDQVQEPQPTSTPTLTPSPSRTGTVPSQTATGTRTPTVGPSRTATASASRTPTPVPTACYSGVIEAEQGTLAAPMQIIADAEASGGGCVGSPAGGTRNEGSVTLSVHVPCATQYHIRARGWAENWNSNSFWVSVDEGAETLWEMRDFVSNKWGWELVSREINGGPVPVEFSLASGPHSIRFRVREPGARLDAIQLIALQMPGTATPTPRSRVHLPLIEG